MPTVVPPGSALAVKLYSVALFAETQRAKTFRNSMIGPAPKQPSAEEKLRGQSSADYPFVRITDLRRAGGETVSVDLFHVIKGKPTMGDRKLTGRLMSLTSSSMDIKVDQCRGGVDPGGRMTQHRTFHNLRTASKANLVGWNARLEDQLALVHVAGDRGHQDDDDWVVPLATDPEFGEIVVNAIAPPTYARRLIAGGGDSFTDIGTSDHLALNDIDRLRALLDELAFPLQPIKLDGDPAAEDQPLYCLWVTSRQWHYIQVNATGQQWRQFSADAMQRAAGMGGMAKHPLFSGSPGMWNGILVKKTRRAIRFTASLTVNETNSAGAVVGTAVAQATDRAVLLGAQALGCAYGKHGSSGYHYQWHEELTDHGNVLEVSTALINGNKKVQFTGSDGVLNDHGVYVVDSYAPAIP